MRVDNNHDFHRKKSLKTSVVEGAFFSAMVGFGESFFIPFAIFLRASEVTIGVVGSLPQTVGALFQLFSNAILKIFKSRKKMTIAGVIAQAVLYVPIMFLISEIENGAFWFVIFVCLYWVSISIIVPVWNSWMGDLVDDDTKCTYFAMRNRILSIVAFLSFLAGGIILEKFTNMGNQALGFFVIFALAMVSRLISAFFALKKYDPPIDWEIFGNNSVKFFGFIKNIKHTALGRYAVFMAAMNFGVFFSAPYFSPHMLKNLNFSYLEFTIAVGTVILFKFVSIPVWGALSDKYGTKKVLTNTLFFIPIIPVLWLFPSNFIYVILLQVLAGFVWAGFEIATFGYIYDATEPGERVKHISYYNVISGLAIFLGAFAGGYTAKHIPINGSGYYTVFALSAVFRAATVLFLLPKVKEVRAVENISNTELVFKVFMTLSSRGIVYSFFSVIKSRNLKKIKKRWNKFMGSS